jgi:NAD(P)-dependent dehydrogenase (short-subunit alcohol dehydrogenase family)
VAIAFAREGADVLVSYLEEHEDAEDTRRWIEEAGRKAVLVPGDLTDPEHCRAIVRQAVDAFGRLDVLVSNAAYQMTHETLEEISDEEWDHTRWPRTGSRSVALGPIWTPLIPSTMPPEQVGGFGEDTPLGRPGQPKEVAPAYVMLASDEASYVSGARIAVTGGKPIL